MSPCSVRADSTCPPPSQNAAFVVSTKPEQAAADVQGASSGNVDGGVSPVSDGVITQGGGDGRRLGHRVLISGRHFAHPVDRRRPRKKTLLSLESPGSGADPEAKVCAGEVNPAPVINSSSSRMQVERKQEEENGEVEGRDCAADGAAVREVFVRFGRDVVQGRVVSDTLVEAYAPARERPGFVDVVVVVAGEGGVGGDLVSDAPSSEMARGRNRCVLFLSHATVGGVLLSPNNSD